MTDDVRDIPPALRPDEWASGEPSTPYATRHDEDGRKILLFGTVDGALGVGILNFNFALRNAESLAALIALANAALHDEDPRKFTHGTVAELRSIAKALFFSENDWQSESESLTDLADVLESYLPPR